jgi:hypothetical protein
MLMDQLQHGPSAPGADTVALTALMVSLGDSGDVEASLDVFDALLGGETEAEALRAKPGDAGQSSTAAADGDGEEQQQQPQAGSSRSARLARARPAGSRSGGGSSSSAGPFAWSNVLAPEWRGVVGSEDAIASAGVRAAAKRSGGGSTSSSSSVPVDAAPGSDSSGSRSGSSSQRAAAAQRPAAAAQPPAANPRRPSSRASSGPWRGILLSPDRRPDLPQVGGPDVTAWNALVNLLVGAGRLGEAEAALDGAVQAADAQQLPPPSEAFAALIKGLRGEKKGGGSGGGGSSGQLLKRQASAQRVLRRFLQLGGQPSRHMCDDVIALCLSCGDVRAARQVVRVMRLTGVLADDASEAGYQSWLERRQAQSRQAQQQRRAAAGGGGSADAAARGGGGGEGGQGGPDGGDEVNMGLERMKWFLGLPNRYYQT